MDEFLRVLDCPEDAAMRMLWKVNAAASEDNLNASAMLRKTCSSLFRDIETLNLKFQELKKSKATSTTDQQPMSSSLSGLDQLYIGDETVSVDAETLWGQVEMQNSSLQKLLKRSIHEINKAPFGDVQLINDDVEESSQSENFQQGNVNSDDEEAKRIRERMERAMNDMDEDEDHEDNDDSNSSDSDSCDDDEVSQEQAKNSDADADLEADSDAKNLHDGFFNLQEMEAFADEEEEYLPEDAYGPVHPDDNDGPSTKDNRSFHQKQRDGDLENNNESDTEDEDGANDLLFRHKESGIRRKKYRDEEEVDALHSIYDAPAKDNLYSTNNNDDDDLVTDMINMTAADIFGKPNRKYYDKYRSKSDANTDRKTGEGDESFDFDREETGAGWNDVDGSDQLKNMSDEEESSDDEKSVEEVDFVKNSRISKGPTKQSTKILAQTEQLEKELLAEKPWQMKGETGSSSRPLNSLLDSTPEFEVASKIAPAITVEHTADLEEIIKKRILAEDWDDVIPRELPDIGWSNKRGVLPEVSQEKSKLGLGELYEREYLKKAVGFDVDAAAKQTVEEKAKNEMKAIFASLNSKLDALSNYHFAPRPIANDTAEVRPITLPAIAMEEILPIHVSDARGVAPEEVFGAKRGREAILRDDSELKQEERKRLRGNKKAARRKARKEKLADEKLISRLQPGIGLNNPYEKRKIREELSMARAGGRVTTGVEDKNDSYGASGTFFKRMQQEAQQAILGGDQIQIKGKKQSREAQTSGKSSSLKL